MNLRLLPLVLLGLLLGCQPDQPARPAPAASSPSADLGEAVKNEFRHAWQGYCQYAWGHDALKPLSRSGHDWYAESLVMTPVDAFSTMKIMALDAEARSAKQLIFERLSFDKDMEVQVFEVNIRLLGGLLSAYQLDGDERFLALAKDLADRLMPAFDSPTGMPYRFVNLRTGRTRDPLNNPAEIGTLLLEWGTLARTTGDPVYYKKAMDALRAVYRRRSDIGLVATVIHVETGEWVDTRSHLSGRIDSYYEYLLKGWRMFGGRELADMWDNSIRAINAHLADEQPNGLWYGWADMRTGERTDTLFGALDAFFPAVLALNGDLEQAARLQDSCYRMWTLHGIEPEMLDYATMTAVNERYVLRPENIESAWYLYHFTGDPRYREMGEVYFRSLVEHCRTETAYAALSSVKTKEQLDEMESFFLAETLKYCYLLFAPRDVIDFDNVILTTEAHPLKIWKTGEGAE